jgi:DNA-binding MarR family transcriptional regulator
MDQRFPLSALLSQALVAFTIEFDNQGEQKLKHRTTRRGSTAALGRGPWLVSMVMWSNCMRFVTEEGITVRDLERRARTKTNLNGMVRWGYVTVKPNPADSRPRAPRSGWMICATPAGRKAREIWRPLFGVIEKRWRERFGEAEIDHLRNALAAVVRQIDIELPDCLPILGYGLFSEAPDVKRGAQAERPVEAVSELPISSLLSKLLLAFAIEFERDSGVSLAVSANVLRLVGEEGVRVRDLPRLAGVSKEAIATSLSFLAKRGYAMVKPEAPGSRVKSVILTPKGRAAREKYVPRVAAIEKDWRVRFGEDLIGNLRELLEHLAGKPGEESPLFRGLEPPASGWRASIPKPENLPHYPMVLHRGGYPDGS